MSKNKFKLLRSVDTDMFITYNYYKIMLIYIILIYYFIIISYCYIVIRHLQSGVFQPKSIYLIFSDILSVKLYDSSDTYMFSEASLLWSGTGETGV